jgi:hypothetical protein
VRRGILVRDGLRAPLDRAEDVAANRGPVVVAAKNALQGGSVQQSTRRGETSRSIAPSKFQSIGPLAGAFMNQ